MTGVSAAPTPLVLATDLDGTFAGGEDAARYALYQLLAERSRCALIYVTGRYLESARALQAVLHLPTPDVFITDVGASVSPGDPAGSIDFPQQELEARWPGSDLILDALGPLKNELHRQEIPVSRRLSFFVGDARPFDQVVDEAKRRMATLDVTIVESARTYLDVLPGGVDKGSTLRRVLRWMGADLDWVVVAGDTLNDAALFALGVKGIVVGNAEPGLRRRVGGAAHVYCATGTGAAGIREGLEAFGMVRGFGEHA